jgi:hypothetical protein
MTFLIYKFNWKIVLKLMRKSEIYICIFFVFVVFVVVMFSKTNLSTILILKANTQFLFYSSDYTILKIAVFAINFYKRKKKKKMRLLFL